MDKIVVGVDLVTLARYELVFLQEVDNRKELKSEQSIRRAIWRYEQFWLPLIAEHKQPSPVLVPPLDVHWVWHCHLLCPRQYEKDCTALVGKLIDHQVLSINSPDYEKESQATERLWTEKYGPSEPFTLSSSPGVPKEAEAYKSKCAYNLLQATTRQASFYYNVSLPHYRDDKFLATALERYKKYLLLTKNNQQSFLVPCYDIDLMWHTHQLMTRAYRDDVTTSLGYVLNHDDTDTDRSPGSKLSDSFLATRQLWLAAYGEEYSIAGAMYRGLSPAGKLQSMTVDQRLSINTKHTKVTLTNVTLEGVDDASKVKLQVSAVTDRVTAFCRLKGPPTSWDSDNPGLGSFAVDTRIKRHRMVFQARSMKGNFLCFSSPNSYEFGYGDLEAEIEATQTVARTPSILMEASRAPRDGMKPPSLIVTYRIEPPTPGDMYLRADAGRFSRATIPETIEQMWGPIPLATLPPGVDNVCATATHGILDHRDRQQFTCRIIHSLPLEMSAVQIFYHDKMVAVSHLIGSEQLPTKTQVGHAATDMLPTLDQSVRERAFLIKDASGDWGVCTAHWTGMRTGIRGKKAVRGQTGVRPVPGHPGYLEGRLYRLRQKDVDKFVLKVARDELTTVTCGAVKLDVKSGNMNIRASEPDVAQYVCVAYTIATLHLLCQPHGQPPGKSVPAQPPVFTAQLGPARPPASSVIYMDDYIMNYFFIASTGLFCDQVPHYCPYVGHTHDSSDDHTASDGSVWDPPVIDTEGGGSGGDGGTDAGAGTDMGVSAGCGGCTGGPAGSGCGSNCNTTAGGGDGGGGSSCGGGTGGGGSTCGAGGSSCSGGGGGSSCGGGGSSCGGGGSSCGSSCGSS